MYRTEREVLDEVILQPTPISIIILLDFIVFCILLPNFDLHFIIVYFIIMETVLATLGRILYQDDTVDHLGHMICHAVAEEVSKKL